MIFQSSISPQYPEITTCVTLHRDLSIIGNPFGNKDPYKPTGTNTQRIWYYKPVNGYAKLMINKLSIKYLSSTQCQVISEGNH